MNRTLTHRPWPETTTQRRSTTSELPSRATIIFVATAALAAILLASSPAFAAYVTVYGGPAYDAATQTGYQSPILAVAPGWTAGNGVAVGSAEKYTGGTSLGHRAVRWDASGAAATELGHLGTSSSGYTDSFAYSVNTAGAAVGWAHKYTAGTNLGQRAVRWNPSSTAATELGHLGANSGGATNAKAFAVNSAGTAVGYAGKFSGARYLGDRAVRWNASVTAATELGHIGTDSSGYTLVEAQAVNIGGTAVGYAFKYSGNTDLGIRAVRWDASGTAATELGNLGTSSGGRTVSSALDVNAAGVAIGSAEKYSPAGTNLGTRAVRWDPSGAAATELGNLGADAGGNTNSNAYALNSAGTAVGWAHKYSPDGTFLPYARAVRWDASGAVTELGNDINNGILGGAAYAVNTGGVAVGYGHKVAGGTFLGTRAMLWDVDAVAIDLDALIDPARGWTLTKAIGISDTNWVTGIGSFDPDGGGSLAAYDRAFLLDVSSLLNSLPGDYNGDGTVDAADYVVWRKNNINGGSGYNTWRANFGATAAGAAAVARSTSAAAVPEPATGALALLGVGSILLLRRRSLWTK
jgi:hypothetical protein